MLCVWLRKTTIRTWITFMLLVLLFHKTLGSQRNHQFVRGAHVLTEYHIPYELCNGSAIHDTSSIRVWSKCDFPNPLTDPDKCGVDGMQSQICDPEHLLNRTELAMLDKKLKMITNETRCGHCGACQDCFQPDTGYIVSVALLNKIKVEVDDDEEVSVIVKNFADYLRLSSWHHGSCGNDIIIVHSRLDQWTYVSLGSVASIKFRASDVSQLVGDQAELLCDGRYYAALDKMLDAVLGMLLLVPNDVPFYGKEVALLLLGIVGTSVVFLLIMMLTGRSRKGSVDYSHVEEDI